MLYSKPIRCRITRQKGHDITAELMLNGDPVTVDGATLSINEERSGNSRMGRFALTLEHHELEECNDLDAMEPIRLFIPMEELPQSITALYMFSPWWTRPAFVDGLKDISDKTQAALFKFKDRFGCFMPMVGEVFKAYLTGGTETELQLAVTALYGGIREVHEPLYLYAEAPTIDEAISTVFREAARIKNIRLREDRRIPEMFRYLGWCSWDAFYTDVNEEGIRQKAAEFSEKQVPVKWMIIDDGWLTLKDRLLYDYRPDPEKFPEGFGKLTEDIKSATTIEWFGVWHALMGYWSGVSPESPVAVSESRYLCKTANGRLVPDPNTGVGFYRDWYRVLNAQGISFVKVDGQGTIPLCFENTMPLGEAARGLHIALENAASSMDGAVINCMGMSMENILSRPSTAISRNSDDFFPMKEDSFKEHLLENAYNALYHNQLYCCDWDMFWTNHPDSRKHALLRAVSGGPVYCSDRVGETIPEVLTPLCYADGELLMMDRSAVPTDDCIFSDPMKAGYLKLQNTARYGQDMTAGGIAVYNLTDNTIACTLSPSEIKGITRCDKYIVFDFFGNMLSEASYDERVEYHVDGNGYQWYVVIPVTDACTCLGLTDKYVGFTAVESIHNSEDSQTVVLHGAGRIAWISDRQPKRITINGAEKDYYIQSNNRMIIVPLDETKEQTIAQIQF